MKQKYPLAFSAFFFLTSLLFAQESCPEKLLKANTLYEQGKIGDAIELTKTCTSSENITDQWQAYRLLAMAYLANNQNTEALKAAENMLELNPRYKPSSLKDPAELIKMLKGITVIPKFSFGLAVSLGTNSAYPKITHGYNVTDYQKTYTGLSSYQFGISGAYQINEHFAIDAMALVSSKKYEIAYAFPEPDPTWKIKVNESLTYLDIPITARYIFRPKKTLRPYVQLGGFAGYLLFSENTFEADYSNGETKYSLEKVSSLDRRNRINAGLTGGLGAFYKMGDGHVFLQANYFHSLSDFTNPDTRYTYQELTYSYYYIDDDFRLNNLAVSLGYSLYLKYKVIRSK